MSSNVKNTLKNAFSPSVIAICGALILGLAGLRLTTSAWEWAFDKKELPLRRQLDAIPHNMGPYKLINSFRLDEGIEERLSTDQYISWILRDTRRAEMEPGSAMRLHVVYYTGNQEPVSAAHVPEICFVGNGFNRVDVRKLNLDVPFTQTAQTNTEGDLQVQPVKGPPVLIPSATIPVREFVYMQPESSESGSVLYFFIYNGQYQASRSGITFQFLDRSSRYTYYCKVEVLPGTWAPGNHRGEGGFKGGVEDRELSRELTTELLAYAMPEIMACLPNWREVEKGTYPKKQTARK